ncbi:MAG: hypothetical protein PVG39_02765 [Desulfobacteraceae bacterium]|jgi:hypothetical protein
MILNINIDTKDLQGKGFGCYLSKSAKKGEAKISLDLNAALSACANEDMVFKKVFGEIILHEILHAIEDLFDKSFNHKRINNAIKKVQQG